MQDTSISARGSFSGDRTAVVPLVIDLDGNRFALDEQVWPSLASEQAHRVPEIASATVTVAPSAFSEFRRRVTSDGDTALNEDDVLELARRARAQGRPIYLVTGRSEHDALGVADRLGLFKGVIASGAGANLFDPDEKISALIKAFGWKGFDYLGAPGVQEIHAAAAQSMTARVAAAGPAQSTPAAEDGLHAVTLRWARALRIHQWAKNALVAVPLLTSHQFSQGNAFSVALAFAAFSLCASGVYLLNDLMDRDADRAHPVKRHRPLAAGTMSPRSALIAIALLWTAAGLAAAATSPAFSAALLAYAVLTTAYTFRLKRYALVDVLTLAALYTLRIVAGALAIDVVLSEWLLIFSIFTFMSLALIKRYAELALMQDERRPFASNRDYVVSDMLVIGALAAASGMNAVTVFSLYISSAAVVPLYHHPVLLWLIDPLLLYWIGRLLLMANRRGMNHDPLVFALRDGPSWLVAALMAGVLFAAA